MSFVVCRDFNFSASLSYVGYLVTSRSSYSVRGLSYSAAELVDAKELSFKVFFIRK